MRRMGYLQAFTRLLRAKNGLYTRAAAP